MKSKILRTMLSLMIMNLAAISDAPAQVVNPGPPPIMPLYMG